MGRGSAVPPSLGIDAHDHEGDAATTCSVETLAGPTGATKKPRRWSPSDIEESESATTACGPSAAGAAGRAGRVVVSLDE